MSDVNALATQANNIYLLKDWIELTENSGVYRRLEINNVWRDLYQRILNEKSQIKNYKEAEFTTEFGGIRYRCNLHNSQAGWGVSMRRLMATVPHLVHDLKLPRDQVLSLLDGTGLTLFCGAMNSGKSTTMIAALEQMDRNRRGALGTVEDPIEYVFKGGNVIQREIGTHVESPEAAIRACVRQQRQTIMVSEIRDPDTANAAVLAASTGHRVAATLHADSAIDAVIRMIALIDPRYEKILPKTINGLWWQHVVRFSEEGRDPLPIYESIKVDATVRLILEGGVDKLQQLPNEMRRQGRRTMAEVANRLVQDGKAKQLEVSEFLNRRGRSSEN